MQMQVQSDRVSPIERQENWDLRGKMEPRDNVPIQLPGKGACACLMLLEISELFLEC